MAKNSFLFASKMFGWALQKKGFSHTKTQSTVFVTGPVRSGTEMKLALRSVRGGCLVFVLLKKTPK
jgi:hypothetical protein